MTSKVAVLLAAYNGTLWLEEQVNSILAQNNVEVKIFISVDKSNDGTERMVNSLIKKHANVVVLEHGHVFGGAAKNFYRLFLDVDFSDFDFVSLSDQDDIWQQDKLYRACSFLSEYMVYSSNVTAFYENGHQSIIDKAQPQVSLDFLFEAAGPGCTYVMRSLVATEFKHFLLSNHTKVQLISLHDWLLYAFSRTRNYSWIIDSYSSLLYRQHANNQVGANNSFSSAMKRLAMIRAKWYRQQVINIVKALDLQGHSFVQKALCNTYSGNIYLLFNLHKIRRRLRDRVAFGMACLLGLF